MKMGKEHLIPLPSQAVAVLQRLQALTGMAFPFFFRTVMIMSSAEVGIGNFRFCTA